MLTRVQACHLEYLVSERKPTATTLSLEHTSINPKHVNLKYETSASPTGSWTNTDFFLDALDVTIKL